MSDTPKKIRDHLRSWLDRQREAAKLVPEVQCAFEDADWQDNAVTFLGLAAPEEVEKVLAPSLELSYRHLCNSLPLPPEYGTLVFSAVATGVTSSTSSVYEAVHTTLKSPTHQDAALEHLTAYQSLQYHHEREARVRQMLLQGYPTSATQYEVARAAYMVDKSQESQASAAASELRNLLDRFKGELFEKARRHPKENMTWAQMVERLVPSSKPATERVILSGQEVLRGRLYDRLSPLTKRRVNLGSDELAHLWTEVLDHLYIMCTGIRDESA